MDGTLGTRYFASLGRGGSGAFAVMGTHSKAKKCPMRPASQQVWRCLTGDAQAISYRPLHRTYPSDRYVFRQVAMPKGHPRANRRFTTAQRDTWVGRAELMILVCECVCV